LQSNIAVNAIKHRPVYEYASRDSLVEAVLHLNMSAYMRAFEATVIFFPELRLLACRETCRGK
jgi:hypothetical protein